MPPVSKLDLSKFPRFALLEGSTRVQNPSRLSKHLGGVEVLVKREDLLGLGACAISQR
jgi:L-cysteate sulfo-lyase